MTKTETLKILAVLRVAYPGFYSRVTPEDAQQAVIVWADFFRNDPYPIVDAAVKAIINAGTKDGYPPDIGAVKEQIRRFTRPEQDTAMDAWNEVKKAISFYDARKTFSTLPELSRRIVGSPNQLREWALMEVETINTIVQSNFLKAYRAKEASYLAQKALPEDVQKLVVKIQEGMMLDGLDGKKDVAEAKAQLSAAGQITGAGYDACYQTKGTDTDVSHPGTVS